MIKLNNLGKTYISNSTLTVGIEHIDDYIFGEYAEKSPDGQDSLSIR